MADLRLEPLASSPVIDVVTVQEREKDVDVEERPFHLGIFFAEPVDERVGDCLAAVWKWFEAMETRPVGMGAGGRRVGQGLAIASVAGAPAPVNARGW